MLSGILQRSIRDVEIIVVDSGSTDATLCIAARHLVKVLPTRPEEFSFGHSLNPGCHAAGGEFIAGAHVYPVYKDRLEWLLALFANPQVALVYGKQRANETKKYSEHQVFARWFPDKFSLNQNHPFCNNANAAIRRELWKPLPYDEELTGLEDIDWAKRVMQLGYKMVYADDAEVVCVHNESTKRICNRYRREAVALKRIFPRSGSVCGTSPVCSEPTRSATPIMRGMSACCGATCWASRPSG
jgi:glycosyltransferase involved in cell wall biosynthesis